VIRGFVLRGLLAGLIGGICAGALGLVIGEGQIDRAIEVETALGGSTATDAVGGSAQSAADGNPGDRSREPSPEGGAGDSRGGAAAGDGSGVEVSRGTQNAGLVVATGIYGLAIGGLVALVFVALRGRTAHRTDARLALGLTAGLFAAVVVIPFLKYPAGPPGVGDPETIGYRTELYLALVAGSLAALLAAWRLATLVPVAHRAWRLAAAIGSFCVLVGLLALALPGVDEVPAAYPADLLTEFRVASAALQVTLWSVLAAGFAILVDRGPSRLPSSNETA
jgi:hypothetical protein